MTHTLMILVLMLAPIASPVQDPPASAWPTASVFDDPPAAEAPARTTPEAADYACRGQIHRRPNETRAACIERLVETDALSAPLPAASTPRPPRCRRESRTSEDGLSFSLSVVCEESTVTTSPPQ